MEKCYVGFEAVARLREIVSSERCQDFLGCSVEAEGDD